MKDPRANDADNAFDDSLDALADLLNAAGITSDEAARVRPREPAAPVPMSFAQELLWLLDRATPGMTAYNMPVARRLRGALDVRALESALNYLVARHEVLRTRLTEVEGSPRQLVDAPAPLALRVIEVAGSDQQSRERDAERIVRERARTPFDMAGEHLFRATLVRIAPEDHVLMLETHHIVMDGWSLGIVSRELSDAYSAFHAGKPAASDSPEIQYGDYAAWQRAQLSGPRLEQLLSFWRRQLGDATQPLELPTDFPRSATPTFAGARESITLSPSLTSALKGVGQAQSATLYMVLLAAYGAVLHRYTGREHVLIGSGSAGRTFAETERLVGYVNNTLVQLADVTGNPTFAELLTRVRTAALGAYDHQDIPLEKLVLELRQGDARLSDAPLFEVVLTMQDTLPSALAFAGTNAEPFGADLGATKFDITLLVAERDGGLNITAQYRSDLFSSATMRRFLGHLERVLTAAVNDSAVRVSEIDLLTDAERAQLTAWNATTLAEGAPTTLTRLFATHAERVGSRVAVTSTDAANASVDLTYAELDARTNQLAHHLRALGVSRGACVGLLLEGSTDAVVALLGILKAGAAYVPLATNAPAARVAQQLGECGARVVVTSSAFAALLPDGVTGVQLDGGDATTLSALPKSAPNVDVKPEDLAYVLFTSGSTGTPKGVEISHANAVHYARAISRVLADVPATMAGDGFAALDGWHFALASSLAADLGNTSLLPSLVAGGTLHVLGTHLTTDPTRFASYMTAHAVDVLKLTPSHLLALIGSRTGSELASVLPKQWIVLGGEALRVDVARTLLGAGSCRVLNHYGPTETTVGVCTYRVTTESLADAAHAGAQTVPIGTPLANTRAYVVDAHAHQHPVGIPGELWLGGDGVARGYAGRADLTAERFAQYGNDRVYRTGDRVRRLATGVIEFLGRVDDQVKIRGYRVELGEIDHVLSQHPGVAQSVTIQRVPEAGDADLVSYVVARSGYVAGTHDRPSSESLRDWVGVRLPEYMVPSAIVMLDSLPLTANGKVDRRALPAPVATASASTGTVAPSTPTQQTLVEIWCDVLKRDGIGITDSFLALGGHSLMAIRLLGRISRAFGVRLPLRTLFEAPTIEQLAEVIDLEAQLAALESLSEDEAARMLTEEPR